MERVIAYVDGYNLYHGLRAKSWRRFYWLNISALAQNLLRPGQNLRATKYFTTIVRRPEPSRLRQAVFLEALQTLLHIGHNELAKSLLPPTVVKPDGVALHCPAHWR